MLLTNKNYHAILRVQRQKNIQKINDNSRRFEVIYDYLNDLEENKELAVSPVAYVVLNCGNEQ